MTASAYVPTATAIGPAGTALRVVAGLGFLYLAGAVEGGSWDVEWFDPLVGFIALPGVMIAIGLIAQSRDRGQIHFTGVLGHALNAGVIVLLLVNPYTAGGAALFYGATMLVAAWRRQRGCESTVISNLILRRDDQIGCPLFLPADEAETRWTARAATSEVPSTVADALDPGIRRAPIADAPKSLGCSTTSTSSSPSPSQAWRC